MTKTQLNNENHTEQDNPKKISKLIGILIVVLLIGVLGAGIILAQRNGLLNSFIAKIKHIQQNNKTDKTEKANKLASGDEKNNIPEKIEKKQLGFPAFNYKPSEVTPKIPKYKISLDELTNLKFFTAKPEDPEYKPLEMNTARENALIKNGFFITLDKDKFFNTDADANTGRVDDWTDLYEYIGGSSDKHYRRPENSIFITSDFALHLYHRLLDKEFKYIEQKEFYPRLEKITNRMFNSSVEAYQKTNNKKAKESYQRLIAYFAIPKAILNSANNFSEKGLINDDKSDSDENILTELEKIKGQMPVESYQIAKTEIERINKGEGMANSSLFGKYYQAKDLDIKEDYTQFVPRSHYEENPILRSYFKTMMWYGRSNFVVASPELTRDAMNITLLMKDNNLLNDWQEIYLPTVFFVGKSDDLGLAEYQKALDSHPELHPGDQLTAQLQKDIAEMPQPKIMSTVFGEINNRDKEGLKNATKGFRFMGQRFVPDAFIFSTLTQGVEPADPETGESLPSTPTALMVVSLLGNKTAYNYLQQWINTEAPNSKKVLAKKYTELENSFNKLTEDDWTQNIYWGWLYTLKAFNNDFISEEGYPQFMKNKNWNDKSLQASLGSWTELKHDTLLYAKQSYAEMGGGYDEYKDIPPVPKGYVEPNIEFWDKLIALAEMTKNGLQSGDLLPQEFSGRNDKLLSGFKFMRDIAIKELNNQKISDDEFEQLRLIAGNMESVILPLPSETQLEKNARSGLIADVHTDAVKHQILYEADAIPNYIYVAVKDVNGTRLTKGLVFSQREFTAPLQKRLTDTDWQKQVYSESTKNLPSLPTWSKNLMP